MEGRSETYRESSSMYAFCFPSSLKQGSAKAVSIWKSQNWKSQSTQGKNEKIDFN